MFLQLFPPETFTHKELSCIKVNAAFHFLFKKTFTCDKMTVEHDLLLNPVYK